MTPPPPPTRQNLSALFTSLAGSRWTLTRTLRSANPADIHGKLTGTATFTPLVRQDSATSPDGSEAGTGTATATGTGDGREMVYKEEGEMPAVPGSGIPPGLRWSKRYLWRLSSNSTSSSSSSSSSSTSTSTTGDEDGGGGGISVWFVKVANDTRSKNSSQVQEEEAEADYLFHRFEFDFDSDLKPESDSDPTFVSPPPPPLPSPTANTTTTILTAHGTHLCINDLYRTAYAFRVRPDTGEVVSWASRHVVKGPRKDQEIVNVYEICG
ncbi:hypothetical protein VTN02DRAFT_5654 [Thermoascus thermophilus]